MIKYVKVVDRPGSDLDIKQVPMVMVVCVKHEEQTDDRIWSFYNPTQEYLPKGQRIVVQTKKGNKNAIAYGCFLIPKDSLIEYRRVFTNGHALKPVAGVYKQVMIETLEPTNVKKVVC